MNPTTELHELGQSLWLDNITRDLLDDGTLESYRNDFSITGLTSNPTIFEQAIHGSKAYDDAIAKRVQEGKSGEELFFELAIEDLTRAAALFLPIFYATNGVDGWVSLEVSPLLVNDAEATISQAKKLHARAACPNLFIKIPGTKAGLVAIEEAIFAGVPVNVTLLFSNEQYVAAADAYCRGIQRRITAGLDPKVESVASIFVSRWDKATADIEPPTLRNRLGVAVGKQAYQSYTALLASSLWTTLADAGAHPQRLLWASTGTKDPAISESWYVEALAAPNTVNTMPEKTLKAFATSGQLGRQLVANGGDVKLELEEFKKAGIDIDALAVQLQLEGAQSFEKSWHALLSAIASKSEQAQQTPAHQE